ncbi:MAG: efflux RND transporter periplasmic adaptor subunit [Pseudomonadota bacterium]
MNHTKPQRQAGRISRPQLIAIIAIVLIGLGASAWLLKSAPSAPAGEAAEEGHGHGHDEAKGHDDGEHHDEKKADAGHDEAKGHDDKEHHEKPGAHAEHDTLEGEGGEGKGASSPAGADKHVEGEEEPVQLNAQQIAAGGIKVEAVGPASIRTTMQLQAAQKRLTLAQTTHAREKKLFEDKISAQMDYQQAVQALREAEIAVNNASQKLKALGAAPTANDLNRYELRAPFDGIVVEKHIALGESVKEDANVFTLSDLSTVWANINVPAKDLKFVRVGEKVTVSSTSFDDVATGMVTYVGALIGEQTRAASARIVLTNPGLAWRPGLFVNVAVTSGETAAAVTVAAGAVQAMEGRQVVFVEVPGGFEAKTVEVGRSDGVRTEIVKGLSAGARYASTNSFVIKAEIGKASAEHSH